MNRNTWLTSTKAGLTWQATNSPSKNIWKKRIRKRLMTSSSKIHQSRNTKFNIFLSHWQYRESSPSSGSPNCTIWNKYQPKIISARCLFHYRRIWNSTRIPKCTHSSSHFSKNSTTTKSNFFLMILLVNSSYIPIHMEIHSNCQSIYSIVTTWASKLTKQSQLLSRIHQHNPLFALEN